MSIEALKFNTTSRQFNSYCVGQTISTVGSFMQGMALAWLTFRITNSASLFGLILFVRQIPMLFLAPVSGWLLDRMDRKHLLMFTQVIGAFPAIIAAYVSFIGRNNFIELLILAISMGVVNGLETPARSTFVTELVDKENLPKAIKINSLIVNVGRLVGPGLAGIFAHYFGEWLCFALNAVSNIFFAIILVLIYTQHKRGKKFTEYEGFFGGVKYAYSNSIIGGFLLLMGALSITVIPFISLLPLFAAKILHADAKATGLLMAVAASGGLIGGIFLAFRKNKNKQVSIITFAIIAAGISLLIFSKTNNFTISTILVFFIGLSLVLAGTSINVVVQAKAQNEVRGRVTALFSVAYLGLTPFGNLFMGGLAGLLGTSQAIFVTGIICLGLPLIFSPLLFSAKFQFLKKSWSKYLMHNVVR
jgi:MFS family permease